MLMNKQRKGIFGAPLEQAAPVANPMAAMPTGAQMPAQAPTAPKAPNRTLGIIADVLAGMNGQQGPYAAMMARQRQAQEAAQAAEQERATSFEDYKMRKQYDASMPSSPYRFESNDGDVYEIGADGKPKQLFDDPTPKMEYFTAKDPMTGQTIITPMPRGGAAPKRSPNPQAIGLLRSDPSPAARAEFDEVFGPGASAQFLGGPQPSQPAQGGLTDDEGGQIMRNATQTNSISRADLERVRRSLGPNGGARFQQWMRDNNIQMVD